MRGATARFMPAAGLALAMEVTLPEAAASARSRMLRPATLELLPSTPSVLP